MNETTILDECAAGAVSPEIALTRWLLQIGLPDPDALRQAAVDRGHSSAVLALANLSERYRDRLPELRQLAQTGLLPDGDNMVEATAELFDRLARDAPEAGVAFYSFGDAAALKAATAELADGVRAWANPAGRRVLDFGCGIGRLAVALADEASEVLAIDVSPGMIEQARRRAHGRANPRFKTSNGRDLAFVDTGSIDLLIAADSLPYIVRADLLNSFMAEAARVLSSNGDLLVFNWSYRGDLEQDKREALEMASRHGLQVLRAGEALFKIWDGAGFHLRRVP